MFAQRLPPSYKSAAYEMPPKATPMPPFVTVKQVARPKDAPPNQRFSIFPATRTRAFKPHADDLAFWRNNPQARAFDWEKMYTPLVARTPFAVAKPFASVAQLGWDALAGGIVCGLSIGLALAHRSDLIGHLVSEHYPQIIALLFCGVNACAAAAYASAYLLGGMTGLLVATSAILIARHFSRN